MKIIPCLLAVFPAVAGAAEGLPALRVDPGLLAPNAPVSKSAAPRASGGEAALRSKEGTAPVKPAPGPGADAAAADADVGMTAEAGSTVVVADRIDGQQDVELSAVGNAQLVRDDTHVRADRIIYREVLDEVEAIGDVRLSRGEDIIRSDKLRVRLDEQTGEVDAPEYAFSRVVQKQEGMTPRTVIGSGHADVLKLNGENQYALKNATWSTCKPADPDWYLKAGELELDYDRELGVARDSTVVFKDVPIFYMPWAEFPLVAQRKSGFLPPTFGTSNKTGVDLSVPYYWNIAPNYDATFVPRYMSRRGLQLGGEYRYLTDDASGTIRAEWMPNDRVAGRDNRAAGSILHQQTFGSHWSTYLNLNGVSDKHYLEDLNSRLAIASQSNLVREGSVSYASGSWWSATMLAQSYQTLTGDKPYRRLPQLTLGGQRPFLDDRADFIFSSEYVRFSHPDPDKPDGSRFVAYPSVQVPLGGTAFSLTPKLGLHYTRYALDQALIGDKKEITRTLPIFTLDSSVVMERDTRWAGRDTIQTLEPRIYYVNIPYRDQSAIPNFDSGLYDFNFAQIFSENIFSGSDRIANANQVTAAVTSRLIDSDSGIERLRFALGQRYYFADQRVTLPGVPARTGRRADILASLDGRLSQDFSLNSGWQYNPRDKITERFNADLRYQPGFAQVVNLGFRYTRDVLRDLDVSGQWPLGGHWYGVARYNRSLRDHRVTEALAGLEYAGDCWVFRTVFHRFATKENAVTQAVFLQLELTDLASVGSSPLDLLRRTVGGYGTINQPVADPVFGQP
ncbi:LPS-assembly protein LptD [Nitrogeniibacter mangrovi]|uniref:LPS-assembly protein LptD n=1 Tax=Nitrogeniibacter mangrovi TaxID=2016596 RepID=A0A6C1B0M5_9RHOO|nr:LPS-assembly protein LptD [Nitrogeniibacter mangrovi]QID17152.1 LPS-assembly protein LptD [Nitrogeniibacter mangrovi]